MSEPATEYRVAYDLYEAYCRPPTDLEVQQVVMAWFDTNKSNSLGLTYEGAQFLIRRLWPKVPPRVRYVRTEPQGAE